jgi:DNA-binding beta-propeller fold protein YncE
MKRVLIGCIFLFILLLSIGCNDSKITPTNSNSLPKTQANTECKDSLCLYDSISLLDIQDRSIDENVLKIFSAASDPIRNRIYVSGILTPHIAIMDGATESWIDTIDSGMGEDYSLKYLYIDPVKNYLYIIDGSNKELRRIDLNNGELKGPVSISSKSGIAAVDTKRGFIYLSSRFSPFFSVYDGSTLKLIFKTDEMGEGTGNIIYDDKNDIVYVLDLLNPVVHVFDPNSLKVNEKLDFQASCCGGNSKEIQYDPDTNTFYVLVARHVDIVNSEGEISYTIDAPQARDIEMIAFEPSSRKILILTLERAQDGEVSGVGGHLEVYEANSITKLYDIPFGKKPRRLAINTANKKAYIPNGDASVLWSIPTDRYDKANPIRLGDSIEQVVLSKNGEKVFVNSRLGGSYIFMYDTKNKTYETFTSGTWPIPIRMDSNEENLFILNAWDSTLSVYSLYPERTLISTISLGIPKGTTDRIPEMIVDSTNSLAYVAYPEFGQIIVVDWRNGKIIKNINIKEFPKGEQSGGPGDIQLAFDDKNQRLISLLTEDSKLLVFDASKNFALLKEVDISDINLKKVKEGANVDLLFIDSVKNRLFVGPYELNIITYQSTGHSLQEGQRIFAFDPKKNVYWVSGVKQGGKTINDIVAVIDAETLKTKYIEILGQSHTTKPSFAIDLENQKLYVGHMTKATLDIFDIGEIN